MAEHYTLEELRCAISVRCWNALNTFMQGNTDIPLPCLSDELLLRLKGIGPQVLLGYHRDMQAFRESMKTWQE